MSLEELLSRSINLYDQILVLYMLWYRHFFSHIGTHDLFISELFFSDHGDFESVERFHVGKLFSVAFEEGGAGEEDFSIDDVVFDGSCANIHSFDPQSAFFINLSQGDIRLLLLRPFQVLLLPLSQSQRGV